MQISVRTALLLMVLLSFDDYASAYSTFYCFFVVLHVCLLIPSIYIGELWTRGQPLYHSQFALFFKS